MKKKSDAFEALQNERNLESKNEKEMEYKYMRCPDHKLEMTLICTEEHCNEKICSRCYLDDHKLHHVMDIDREQLEYQKLETNINKLIVSSSEELEGGKRQIEQHYNQELQKLQKFQKDTIAVINRKQQEIAQDRENNLRKMSDIKSNLDKAKAELCATKLGKAYTKVKRMNACQAERLHKSVLQKMSEVKQYGITTRSNKYGNAQKLITSQLSLTKMQSAPSSAPIMLKRIQVLHVGKLLKTWIIRAWLLCQALLVLKYFLKCYFLDHQFSIYIFVQNMLQHSRLPWWDGNV